VSIVPVRQLSPSDRALLGNNLRSAPPAPGARPPRSRRRLLAAVNRSLAAVGETVGRLYPRRLVAR